MTDVWARIRAALLAPSRAVDDDEFDTAIVRQVLVALVIATSLTVVLLALTGTFERLVAPAVLWVVSGGGVVALRRVDARRVAWVILTAFVVLPTVFQAFQGGVRDPAGFVGLAVIAFAAVTLGRWAALIALVGTLAGATVLFALEQAEVIDPEPTSAGVGLIVRIAVTFALGVLLIAYLLQRERGAAQRAAALRERDRTVEFYDRILGASSVMVAVIDARTGDRVWASPALIDLLGLTPEEFNALPEADRWALIHPDDRAAEQKRLAEVQAGRIPDVGTTQRLRTPRGWRWHKVEYTRLETDDGPPLRLESATDVHERTEADRRRLSLLAASPIPVAIRSIANREVTYVNPAWSEVTGYDVDTFNAEHGHDVHALVHVDDHAVIDDAIATMGAAPFAARFLNADGEYRWYQTEVRRHDADGDGEDDELLFFHTDVSEMFEARARADVMIDRNPVAQVIFDFDSNIIEFGNDALYELSGRTIDEWNALGEPRVRAGRIGTPAEDLPGIFEAIERALATGEATGVRRRWLHADGTVRWLDCRYRSFPDPLRPEGRRILMTAADVTEQVAAEAQSDALLASAPILVTISDVATGARDYVSPEFVRFTGHTLDDYNALTRDEQLALVHPDDRAAVQANAERFAESDGREGRESTYRLRSVDGYRWVATTATILATNVDGSIAKLMITGIDIDNRVEADAYRATILDSSPAGIAVYDVADGQATYVNAEFRALSGYDLDTLQGLDRPALEVFIAGEERDEVMARANEAVRTGEATEVRHRVRHADGSIAWYQSRFMRFDTARHTTRLIVSSVAVTAEMEAEARSQAILDVSPTIILVFDPDENRTHYANPTFTEVTGFTVDDLARLDRTVIPNLVHPDDTDAEAAAITEAIETGRPVSIAHRLRTADGAYVWLETRYRHFPDAAGIHPRRILISSIDITDRLESEERERALLAVSPAMTLVFDVQTQTALFANQSFRRARGLPDSWPERANEGELLGEAMPVDDRARVGEAVMAALDDGEPRIITHRQYDHTGALRHLQSHFAPFPDPLGVHGTRVVATSIDVTARVEAEALSETILASSPAPTVVVDAADGRTVYANPAFTAATGHTAASLNAMPQDEMFALTPADERARVDAAINRTLETGEVSSVERTYRSADGTTRWFDSRFLRLPSGRGDEVVITAIDTSARRAAAEALEAERLRLERANRDLQEFVYIASHDLQEPLRTMSAFSDLLSLELPDDLTDDARTSLDFIRQGAGRMRELVQGLLEYSRIGPDREVAEVDMPALVDQLLEDLGDQIAREGASVTTGTLPSLLGDATELRLILQNLVSNAIKFRDPERPPVVHIDAEPTGDGWRFTVADNGIGIADRHADRIFAIFQRLHGADAYEGTGMGLAHAKRAVANHGGEIGVDAEPGVGSTFWFTVAPGGEP